MKVFYSLLITLFIFVTLSGQTTSLVADNVAEDGPMYYFHGKKIARTTNGILMVVWVGSDSQINFSTYDDAFDTWSPPAAVSSAVESADKPAIAADELGNIHACWQERPTSDDNYIVMYANYNGTIWSSPAQVSLHDANECEEASIEVDSDNNIWIVYNNDGAGEPDEFVYVVNSTDGGSTWSTSAEAISASGYIGSSITNGRCTLVAGPDGKLAAVWHNGLPSDSGRREVYFNQYDGTAWAGEVMISDTTGEDRAANWYPTVAVDNNATIYVIYHTNDVSSDTLSRRYVLLQKKAWNDTWDQSSTSVLHTETAGDLLGTSAIADENNVVHLVYRLDIPDDTTGIDGVYYKFSKDEGESWSENILVSRAGYDGGYATIANKVRTAYGVDITFRESYQQYINDQDTTAILYANIPYDLITSVEKENQIPDEFEVLANYPNPFNPSTTFSFNVIESGNVTLRIYDSIGNEVRTLVNKVVNTGSHEISWSGENNNNRLLSSGVYFATLQTLNSRSTVKVLLLK